MNKKEVVALLGVSSKAVERYVQREKLTPTYEKGRPIFDREQVEGLKREMEAPRPVVTTLATRPKPETVAPVSPVALPGVEELSMRLEHLTSALVEQNAEALMVSPAEAAKMTGISEKVLRDAIAAGRVKHYKGPGWGRTGRVKIADVRYFVRFVLE